MNFQQKVSFFIQSTDKEEKSYADSFQGYIHLIAENHDFYFLEKLTSEKDITDWIEKLKSRLVMKEHILEIDEMIEDYIQLG